MIIWTIGIYLCIGYKYQKLQHGVRFIQFLVGADLATVYTGHLDLVEFMAIQ